MLTNKSKEIILLIVLFWLLELLWTNYSILYLRYKTDYR